MLEGLDRQVSLVAESVARAFSRRRFLGTGVKGVFALVAGIALGEFIDVKGAMAAYCDPAHGVYCTGCPAPPNLGGCPSNLQVCKHNSGCSVCPHPYGSWTNPCGVCGQGIATCTDCWDGSNCSGACTCYSGCFCTGCCTPQQVAAEARRLGLTLPASVRER